MYPVTPPGSPRSACAGPGRHVIRYFFAEFSSSFAPAPRYFNAAVLADDRAQPDCADPVAIMYRNPPSGFWHFSVYLIAASTVFCGTTIPAFRADRSPITWQIVADVSAVSGRG